MTIIEKPPEQLAKEDLIRQTLEAAAHLLETQSSNKLYMAAWKAGAKLIREKLRNL